MLWARWASLSNAPTTVLFFCDIIVTNVTLLQAVLAGVGDDRAAAASCLDEMFAARLHQQRRSSDGGARHSADGGSSQAPLPPHAPDSALQDASTSQPTSHNVAAAAAERWPHGYPAEPADDHELAADLAEEPYRCVSPL